MMPSKKKKNSLMQSGKVDGAPEVQYVGSLVQLTFNWETPKKMREYKFIEMVCSKQFQFN